MAEKGKRVTTKDKQRRRGRTSQHKGKKWQHAIAKIFAEATGCDPKDMHSNHGGVKGEEDVHRSAAAKEACPFWIEGKNTRRLLIGTWWAQLQEDREAARCVDPGIIISKLYGTSEALVTMNLVDFLHALYGPLTPDQEKNIRSHIKMVKVET